MKSIDYYFIFSWSVGWFYHVACVFLILFENIMDDRDRSVSGNVMLANAIEFHFCVLFIDNQTVYVMYFRFKFMY